MSGKRLFLTCLVQRKPHTILLTNCAMLLICIITKRAMLRLLTSYKCVDRVREIWVRVLTL